MAMPPQGPYLSPTPPIGDQPYTHIGTDGPAPKPAHKHRRWPWALGIVLALVVGTYLGASDEDATALAAAECQLADLHLSLDGTWVVGEDIAAGVYRNEGGGSCYWERLSGLSGEFGDIIANGLPDGPTVVEIAGADTAFSSQRCGTWTRQ